MLSSSDNHRFGKGVGVHLFYCKDVPLRNRLEGLPTFEDRAGIAQSSWKKKLAAKMLTDLAAIKARIIELASSSPPLTREDTIICWMKRRIQPLQHRTRLMCEYIGEKTDPMHISKEDLSEVNFEGCFNKLIKSRSADGRQYDESRPMYTTTNPPPKVLVSIKQSSIL